MECDARIDLNGLSIFSQALATGSPGGFHREHWYRQTQPIRHVNAGDRCTAHRLANVRQLSCVVQTNAITFSSIHNCGGYAEGWIGETVMHANGCGTESHLYNRSITPLGESHQ